jgi:hypothetical protein
MEYNMFEPRAMTRVVNTLFPPATFFLSTFFSGPAEEHTTEAVDIDIVKGSRRVAAYTRASAKSTPLAREKFSTASLKLPYIKLSRSLEAVQTLLRMPGENIYSQITPAQRAARQMVKDMKDLNDAIVRAEELQAAQAIIDAKVIIKGNEVDAEIDFGRDAALEFSATNPWDLATPGIWNFLRETTALIFSKSGYTPNNIIMGKNALAAFIADEETLSMLDNSGIVAGQLNVNQPVTSPFPNARMFGSFGGFTFWEYYEVYNDPVTDVVTPLVPDDYIVFTSPGMICVPHYGVIKDFGALIPLKRFSKSYKEEDPSQLTMIVQSSPAMINHTPDATAKVKVTNV